MGDGISEKAELKKVAAETRSSMKEVRQLSQERVKLSTGTLYGAINRLLELGWIERVEIMEPSQNGRLRKEYCLTRQGKDILSAETRRLRSLLSSIDLKLGGEIS